MSFDMVKFDRGQVWRIKNTYGDSSGREQAKDRPWLVLSVRKFNHSSGMITAVPITTRDKVVSPAQTLFTNCEGVKNVVLCEQIRSFDTKSNSYKFEFMGTLSDEVLNEVDVALSVHLGLHYSPLTLNRLHESMEAIIRSSKYIQELQSQPKFTDDDVIDFADKLMSLVPDVVANAPQASRIPTAETVLLKKADNPNKYLDRMDYFRQPELSVEETPEIKYDRNAVVKDNIKKYWDNKNLAEPKLVIDESSDKIKIKKPRIKWTPETCKEFLNDFENMPMKDLMNKWGLEKKPRVYSMKHYVEGLLKK